MAENLSADKSFIVVLTLRARGNAADTPLPPDLSSEVTIRKKEDIFQGTVESVDVNIVTSLITLIKGSSWIVLSDRRGYVRFEDPGHGFHQEQNSVQRAMCLELVPGALWQGPFKEAARAAGRRVPFYPAFPGGGRHSFSIHSIDVRWLKIEIFADTVEASKQSSSEGAVFPAGGDLETRGSASWYT